MLLLAGTGDHEQAKEMNRTIVFMVASSFKQLSVWEKSKCREIVLAHTYLTCYTNLEVALLKILISNKGRVLDREFLLNNVWKDSGNIHKKTVNVAMKRLKEKIDPLKNKEYIKTIRGVGYLLS